MIAENKEWQLVNLAGELSGIGAASFELCKKLGVNLDGSDSERWISTINGDNSPLELCITMGENRCHYRLIADPHPEIHEPAARLKAGEEVLAIALLKGSAEKLTPYFEQAINLWVQKDEAEFQRTLSKMKDGVMWIALGLDTPGVALYLEGNIASQTIAWERAKEWLTRILPFSEEACEYIDKITPYTRLGSIGIEGSDVNNARVKLYWRLLQPVSFTALALPIITNSAFPQFMRIMAGDQADYGFSKSGLIFSVGFSLATGELIDSKLDICGCPHCINISPKGWISRVQQATQTFGIMMPPIEDALLKPRAAGLLLGLGIDKKGRYRLNFYLKPGISI